MSTPRSGRRPPKPEPCTPSRHENGTRTAHASRRRRRRRRRRTHVFRPAERCARDVLIGRIRPAPVEGQHYRATCAALAQRRRAGWGQRLVVPRPALLVSLALHRPPAGPPSTARPSAPRTGRAPLRVSPRRATSRFSSRIPPPAFLPQAHGPHFPPLMFALGTTFQWGKTSEAAKPDSRPQKFATTVPASLQIEPPGGTLLGQHMGDRRPEVSGRPPRPSRSRRHCMSVSHQDHGLVGAAWSPHGSRLGSQLGWSRKRLSYYLPQATARKTTPGSLRPTGAPPTSPFTI